MPTFGTAKNNTKVGTHNLIINHRKHHRPAPNKAGFGGKTRKTNTEYLRIRALQKLLEDFPSENNLITNYVDVAQNALFSAIEEFQALIIIQIHLRSKKN